LNTHGPGDGLVEAVRVAAKSMPVGHIDSLAAALTPWPRFSEAVTGPILGAMASSSYRENAGSLLSSWAAQPDVPGLAVAIALRAASTARADALHEATVEVVWTGPTSHEVAVRRTREVFLELIEVAARRLTVISFAAYQVPEITRALSEARSRGVDVRLVLESAEDSEGRLSHDASAAFESLRDQVAFYVWPGDQRESSTGARGTLHAKAVVADANAALVTSANLTGQALAVNMELGLLVRGGRVPQALDQHFDELIARGVIRRVTNGSRAAQR
jgi:cardiolipin synthase A/B